jgi:hypothetical protein
MMYDLPDTKGSRDADEYLCSTPSASHKTHNAGYSTLTRNNQVQMKAPG